MGINQGAATAFKMVTLEMMSMERREIEYKLDCLVLPTITGRLQELHMDTNQLQIPESVYLADKHFYSAEPIDMLIGAELFWDIIETRRMPLNNSGLMLHESTLGWLVSGRVPIQGSSPRSLLCNVGIMDIQQQLQKLWQVEDFSHAVMTTSEERQCEDHFKKHVHRDATGRYIVRMPRNKNEH